MRHKQLKPFVKWAGGKGKLISEMKKLYPEGLGRSIKKYVEPFVGGGAVLFDVLNNYNVNEVYVSDTNQELINTYVSLRDNVDGVIELLLEYQNAYIPLPEELRKEYYYKKRARFNELKGKGVLNTEMAALLIFLNRTCFNGLYRVNSKGEYNVPMGTYKNPKICDEDNLRMVSHALCGVTIKCEDYRASKSFIDDKTFVYFDPPYRPLTKTSGFTAYTENNFDDEDQKELASYIKEISKVGCFVLASNSDPKNADPNDNFFDDLYEGLNISRVNAVRTINSNVGGRGEIKELLICNY